MTTREITLEQWTDRGCEGTFNFTAGRYSGWAHRTVNRDRREVWQVTISNDRAWRQVEMPLKRGRTLKTAIIDAITAFPDDPQPRPDGCGNFYWGSSHTID